MIISAITIGIGSVLGLGGQDAVFWIVKTFGTASTGTPIADLFGETAIMAVTTWLGEGAIAAGGLGHGIYKTYRQSEYSPQKASISYFID